MAEPGPGGGQGPSAPGPSAPGGSGRAPVVGRRIPASISPGRLPTMRSRDLTLGGVKKKTFTPNIIGRKAKDESKVEGEHQRTRRDGERGGRGGRGPRERGRGRGRPEVIQSHSIFEQGPSEMMKKRGTYESERDAPSVGPLPIINIKKEKRETEEETKEILRKLERDNFIDDPHLCSEQRSCPVQLPLAVSGWGFREEFSPDVLKTQKKEEEEEEAVDAMDPEPKVKPDLTEGEIKKMESAFRPPPLPEPDVLPELLHRWSLSKGEELFFVQLPDSLPGQPPSIETRPVKTEVQSADGQVMVQTEKQDVEAEENSCTLKDLREGLVGKLLVRKSGRVQLLLGHITLDVSLGTSCAFLQVCLTPRREAWSVSSPYYCCMVVVVGTKTDLLLLCYGKTCGFTPTPGPLRA
ncbi:hypothetical protein NHX12_028720 [Muraenolepis orangiensis]|uniref:DNA-directed RNA polymerase III subunit RPC4 n=1 Tax=Muraenolepis orangiensis TaxID=630683 RepID=A0A9Q0EAS2_9TELE|nr:hypothetical protein NHX12_028720 [Muraenolepis orangiensis]